MTLIRNELRNEVLGYQVLDSETVSEPIRNSYHVFEDAIHHFCNHKDDAGRVLLNAFCERPELSEDDEAAFLKLLEERSTHKWIVKNGDIAKGNIFLFVHDKGDEVQPRFEFVEMEALDARYLGREAFVFHSCDFEDEPLREQPLDEFQKRFWRNALLVQRIDEVSAMCRALLDDVLELDETRTVIREIREMIVEEDRNNGAALRFVVNYFDRQFPRAIPLSH